MARRWMGTGLALYIGLLVLAGLISAFPGAGAFVWKLFMETLGEVPIFSLAAKLVDSYVEVLASSQGQNAAAMSELLLTAILRSGLEATLSAAIIGLCIIISTEATTNVVWQKGRDGVSPGFVARRTVHFTVIPLILGIVAGVVITRLISKFSSAELQGLLYAGISIALLLMGIRMMLGYRNKRDSLGSWLELRAVGILKDLLVGMAASALCAVAAASLAMAPSYAVFSGTFWGLAALYLVSTLIAVFVSQL